MMNAAMNSGLFPGDIKYTTDDKDVEISNVKFDNEITREKTGWLAKYNFSDFMKSGGQDWYLTSGLWHF